MFKDLLLDFAIKILKKYFRRLDNGQVNELVHVLNNTPNTILISNHIFRSPEEFYNLFSVANGKYIVTNNKFLLKKGEIINLNNLSYVKLVFTNNIIEYEKEEK